MSKGTKPSKLPTKSDSFCIMPWVHLHVSQNGNVIPCCQAPPHKVHRFGNINEQSILEIWQSKEIIAFRQKMLNNELDHRCKQCYLKEERGAKSLREITNNKFADEVSLVQESKSTSSAYPIHFDIRFSNACNLKCRICGPWASSKWHKDAIAMGMRDTDSKALTVAIHDEKDFFNQLVPLLPEAKEFYFAGGEPLMMEQHYQILDALVNCGNTSIRLSYNTNFSTFTFKSYNVVDYWKQFNNIHITASLDAEGRQGEFLRKNLDWENVIKNRELCMKELPHMQFQIAPTVCIFNIALLPSFHKNWVAKGFINVEDFIPNILIHPKAYHISVLSEAEQATLMPIYRNHIKWIRNQKTTDKKNFFECIQQFESILHQLGTIADAQTKSSFKEKTKLLDSIRKEDSKIIFPEISSLFN